MIDYSDTEEIWLPVVGFEGMYEVSSLGRVHSVPRVILRKNGIPQTVGSRLLSQVNSEGYPQVTLSSKEKNCSPKVHTLVARAFLGPRTEGMEVRHLNGDKTDNRLVNLVYGTQSENNLDRVKHGTHHESNKTHCPSGHPYSGDNLYISPSGGRHCLECKRRIKRESYRRRKYGSTKS